MSEQASAAPFSGPSNGRQRPWDEQTAVHLPPAAGFAPHEHWAWARIIRGQVADMSRYSVDAEIGTQAWLIGVDDGAGDKPDESDSWPQHRVLSERFLRTILFHEPWSSAIESWGVRVRCGRIDERLNWRGRVAKGEVWFDNCRFNRSVLWQDGAIGGLLKLETTQFADGFDVERLLIEGALFCRAGFQVTSEFRLIGARVRGDAYLGASQLKGRLVASRLQVGGSLYMSEGFVAHEEIDLVAARISGELHLSEATFKRRVAISSLRVAGDVFCTNSNATGEIDISASIIEGRASFAGTAMDGGLQADGLVVKGGLLFNERFSAKGEMNLIAAHVGKQLSFDGAKIEGNLSADQMIVDGQLYCYGGFHVTGQISMRDTRIHGQAAFTNAILEGRIIADSLFVDGDLSLDGVDFRSDVSLRSARVGGAVLLKYSLVQGRLDFTGATMGELNLEQTPPSRGADGDSVRWGPEGRLILRNAKIGALAGGLTAFRRTRTSFAACDISGFSFEHLGGIGSGARGSTLASAEGYELRAWLKQCRSKDHFDPAPYIAVATGLKASGRADRAADVRNALGNYELMARGTPILRRLIVLPLSWLFIGYGERNHRALLAFALLVLFAALVGYWQDLLHLPAATPAGWEDAQAWRDWLGYAFGDAIPLLSFDDAHKTFLVDRFCGEKTQGGSCEFGVPIGLTAFFYGVKLLGFVILSYLAAGLSGLAQRRD